MCIGVPMRVIEPRGWRALCGRDGETREIDMILTGEQPVGAWVLVFQDSARRVLDDDEARKIGDALTALSLALEGESDLDHLFPDLAGREPQLPDHLKQPRSGS
jgi:hydrogenase expression/formation protein HypC